MQGGRGCWSTRGGSASRPLGAGPAVLCVLAHPALGRPPPRAPQVIDLISLKPFDMATIAASVRKTRRVLIVEECMKTGGIGASLSAVISESLFDELDHQVGGAWVGRVGRVQWCATGAHTIRRAAYTLNPGQQHHRAARPPAAQLCCRLHWRLRARRWCG